MRNLEKWSKTWELHYAARRSGSNTLSFAFVTLRLILLLYFSIEERGRVIIHTVETCHPRRSHDTLGLIPSCEMRQIWWRWRY